MSMSSLINEHPIPIHKFDTDERVASVISVSNQSRFGPITDEFDILLLVVTYEKQTTNYHTHYIREPFRVQERWIHLEGLRSWILNGLNRYIIDWILGGDVLLDKNNTVSSLREELVAFPMELRKQKRFIQFSFFLRKYLQSKEFLSRKQYLDAYSNILEALHHWARISIIEHGKHPELTVWNQIHDINPGIYKLYEELILSEESLDKRVQLVLLACEFSVMTKMEDCCQWLIDSISSREKPWSASELKEHLEIKDLHIEFSLVLRKLVARGILKEVVVSNALAQKELLYTVK